jgi:LmbE family N-acetylglucosaminyl deacetylase
MPVGLRSQSPAFYPARPGTPELLWETALMHELVLEIPRTRVLIVSPHPDDEILGAGGLIRAAAEAGHEVTVLSVTDGEAAYPDWRGLGAIRRREVDNALAVLTPRPVATQHLSIPDGRVGEHRAPLVEAIDRRISASTLLVAPYERDGHPDHDATGEVCFEIARVRHVTLWRYPIWTWHHSTPDRFAGKSLGRFVLDAAAIQAKARAMSCFRSQMRPLGRQPIVPPHVLPYFTRPYEAFLI